MYARVCVCVFVCSINRFRKTENKRILEACEIC